MAENNSTNLMQYWPTTTDAVYYGPNPYKNNTVPYVEFWPPSTTLYLTPPQSEKSIKEKIQDLRKDLKQYDEALDELAGLVKDLSNLIERRRRPVTTNDTQDGMKT